MPARGGTLPAAPPELGKRGGAGRLAGTALAARLTGEGPMSQILLDIPDDSLLALRVSADEFAQELRMAARRQGVRARQAVIGGCLLTWPAFRGPCSTKLSDYGVAAFSMMKEEEKGEGATEPVPASRLLRILKRIFSSYIKARLWRLRSLVFKAA